MKRKKSLNENLQQNDVVPIPSESDENEKRLITKILIFSVSQHNEFCSAKDAITFFQKCTQKLSYADIRNFYVLVDYSNGDCIKATLQSIGDVKSFLAYI